MQATPYYAYAPATRPLIDADMTDSAITRNLIAWQADPSDPVLADQLANGVYAQLRSIAAARLRRELSSTLTPTELVHEAWLRIKPPDGPPLARREQFLKFASTAMRNVLVDQARERLADKRGSGRRQVTLSLLDDQALVGDEELLDLDRALDRLALDHPRVAEVVLLRCFGGLTMDEIAVAHSSSLSTIKRDWLFGSAWLADAMRGMGLP